MHTKSVGATLLRKRVSPEITQGELAKALGVSQQAVSGWISGHSKPSRDRAVQIERLFGIPVSAWSDADEHQGAA